MGQDRYLPPDEPLSTYHPDLRLVAQACPTCPTCQAVASAQSSLAGLPVIYSPSYTIFAPGGVVGSTVELRVSAHIPLIIPGGFLFGMERILNVSAQAAFRQEGW